MCGDSFPGYMRPERNFPIRATHKLDSQVKENIKLTVAALALLSLIAGGIWLDNHMQGFDPIETRMHP